MGKKPAAAIPNGRKKGARKAKAIAGGAPEHDELEAKPKQVKMDQEGKPVSSDSEKDTEKKGKVKSNENRVIHSEDGKMIAEHSPVKDYGTSDNALAWVQDDGSVKVLGELAVPVMIKQMLGMWDKSKFSHASEFKTWLSQHEEEWKSMFSAPSEWSRLVTLVNECTSFSGVDLNTEQPMTPSQRLLLLLLGYDFNKPLDFDFVKKTAISATDEAVEYLSNKKSLVIMTAGKPGSQVNLGCLRLSKSATFTGEGADKSDEFFESCCARIRAALDQAQRQGNLKVYMFCPAGTITVGKFMRADVTRP